MPTYNGVSYNLNKRNELWQVSATIIETTGKRRVRQSFSSREEAEDTVKSYIDRAKEGMTAVPPKLKDFSTPTLQRVFEMVRDGKWKGTKGERTAVKNAEDCVKHLDPNTPIDALTTEDIDGLIAELKEQGLQSPTVRRKLTALNTLIRYALKRHWIKAMPYVDMKSAGKERSRLRFISDEEERQMMEYLRSGYAPGLATGDGPAMADFLVFLIDTGLRLSEGVNLKWSEVDSCSAVRLGFDNKAEEPRLVPFTERVVAIFKALHAARKPNERRVWPNLTKDRVEWFWSLCREKLELTYDPKTGKGDRDFVIHSCRHTFASRLAMSNVPLNVIKELGGWRTLAMVLKYAHLMPKQKEDAIKQMQAHRKTGTNA